jgi:hypothetical protein
MAKLDFEKDRRRRMPKDVCTDAPWRSDFAPPSAPPSGGSYPLRHPLWPAQTSFEPSSVSDRLRAITKALAGSDFVNLPPWKKLEALAKIQALLQRIVDIYGSTIKATQPYRSAEASCSREAKALRKLSRV